MKRLSINSLQRGERNFAYISFSDYLLHTCALGPALSPDDRVENVAGESLYSQSLFFNGN
jgi:hypothetical protein